MKITPEMFGLTKEEVAKQEALDKRIENLKLVSGLMKWCLEPLAKREGK